MNRKFCFVKEMCHLIRMFGTENHKKLHFFGILMDNAFGKIFKKQKTLQYTFGRIAKKSSKIDDF